MLGRLANISWQRITLKYGVYNLIRFRSVDFSRYCLKSRRETPDLEDFASHLTVDCIVHCTLRTGKLGKVRHLKSSKTVSVGNKAGLTID